MRNASTTGKANGYGFLYSHPCVLSTKGLAPTGWSIPTKAQWLYLMNYLDSVNPVIEIDRLYVFEWESADGYAEEAVVYYNERIYECISASTPGEPPNVTPSEWVDLNVVEYLSTPHSPNDLVYIYDTENGWYDIYKVLNQGGALSGLRLISTDNQWRNRRPPSLISFLNARGLDLALWEDEYKFTSFPTGTFTGWGTGVAYSYLYAAYWTSDSDTVKTDYWISRYCFYIDLTGFSGNRPITSITAFPEVYCLAVRCLQSKAFGEVDGDMGVVEDIDGNEYDWVVIGDYRWFCQDLRTTRFRDSGVITIARPDTPLDLENLLPGHEFHAVEATKAQNNFAFPWWDEENYLVYPPGRKNT